MSLRTGTTSPLGEETATEMSMKFRWIISIVLESMTELTIGLSYRAKAVAFMKKDIIPNLTPYFFWNSSPSSFLSFRISVMSMIWKVVTEALVF